MTIEEKYLALRNDATNDNHGVDSVHMGHLDIADNDIGLRIHNGLDGVDSRMDGRSIEASLIENDSQCVGKEGLIIHHKYVGHIGHSFRCTNAPTPGSGGNVWGDYRLDRA